MPPDLIIRQLEQCDYQLTLDAMKQFTAAREQHCIDELWLLQHAPVYTLGRNGRQEHLLDTADIPVLRVDRGGQVTYHGPGQVVMYVLLDLQRRHQGIRQLVKALENSVIQLLATDNIMAVPRRDAPGVYVDNQKIASLGLRVTRGKCYHGLSLNVSMDLTPFNGINPCGIPGLMVTQLADLTGQTDCNQAGLTLSAAFAGLFGYQRIKITEQGPDLAVA
ncbi:MAG: lipoyl(octanoyl) transferase LipB [Gammaproteobacteria bacterium]|nr:MAG: lipoyl(octanoyl) transferase LipB [Gammaproteobacteria bacterium]